MNWRWIVDTALHTVLLQMSGKLVPLRMLHHVQVIHVRNARALGRQHQVGLVCEHLAILLRSRPPQLVGLGQVAQLDGQNRGLQRIEPAVVAQHLVIVLRLLAVVSQHANPLGNLIVVGHNNPAVAVRA